MKFSRYASCLVLGTACCLPLVAAETKETKAPTAKPAPVKTVAKTAAYNKTIECLSAAHAAAWTVENPLANATQAPFTIKQVDGKEAIVLSTAALEPARTTVRDLLPGDGPENGDVWARNRANYVSLMCKSSKPVDMTFHLLQRGKSAGMYQAGFSVTADGWQKVILPLQQFGLKSFGKVAGIGFRLASAENDTEVSVAEITIGAMPYNDDNWKKLRGSIDLKGLWQFAADPGEQGATEKWYAEQFNDASWKPLKTGLSWQEQGITHHGWGWYRKKIMVPKEYAGMPMTITLAKILNDDDMWVNGVHVGGLTSEYKYDSQLVRAYTVPASVIKFGQENTIAVRIWGGSLTFIGNKSGLVNGPLVAEFDPFRLMMRESGKEEVPAELFDLSDTRAGKPFEIVFALPAELAKSEGAQLIYRIADFSGNPIKSGKTQLSTSSGNIAKAVAAIDGETAQLFYLRGRFRASLLVEDASGNPLYSGVRELDRPTYAKQDTTALPALAEKTEQTPYGQLKLVDEIDCATALADDPHPYMQSGFHQAQMRNIPGSPVDIKISDILGKKARESGYGWFAYRIGRGSLKPHTTYLLRIEYPEDKPRFAPIEIQTGQNFSDIGWRNGVSPTDPYDNWPLSNTWQWYDVIVPLDDQTVGSGGTGSASARNGFWVYFMNKLKPNAYYAMWSGGPAVARIKLYEIDSEKNAPVIHTPAGLPQRTFSFDWERQADHAPADFCQYAKLMGYNAISPIMIKWFFANYSDPLNGYTSTAIDSHDYWVTKPYDPASGEKAGEAYPGAKSQHARYLEATKQYGIQYIPRVEWGGSQDLPVSARAIDSSGQPAKPNRFAPWCSDLLQPATWDDLQKLMDHLIKPYVKDNPQLTGILWRIRCNRLPVSYSKYDIELFAKETGTKLPPGGEGTWAGWASGEIKSQYDDWWHKKRAQFHAKLAELLQSYRSGMKVYYFNWDEDKFGLIQPSTTAWAFLAQVVKPLPDGGRATYEKEAAARAKLTAADYLEVLRTGNFASATNGHINRADYGIRPSLYKDIKGFEIFAPVDYLCYALPEYFDYFKTAEGVAMSNVVSYDEIASRSINPKYEGNMMTPAGGAFSMALELLGYFYGDARTLNYTVYTYGRGFADAHRRFAQAYLALPAIPGTVVDQGNQDLKVRTYPSPNGTYLGVAYKGYSGKTLTIKVQGVKTGATIKNLVTDQNVPATITNGELKFELPSGPMELNAFLIQ